MVSAPGGRLCYDIVSTYFMGKLPWAHMCLFLSSTILPYSPTSWNWNPTHFDEDSWTTTKSSARESKVDGLDIVVLLPNAAPLSNVVSLCENVLELQLNSDNETWQIISVPFGAEIEDITWE